MGKTLVAGTSVVQRTIAGDLDVVTELAGLALDLDAVVEELLERRAVEDTVTRGARVVDDELVLSSSSLSSGGLGLMHTERREETPELAY